MADREGLLGGGLGMGVGGSCVFHMGKLCIPHLTSTFCQHVLMRILQRWFNIVGEVDQDTKKWGLAQKCVGGGCAVTHLGSFGAPKSMGTGTPVC